jgi:hypothetical protein
MGAVPPPALRRSPPVTDYPPPVHNLNEDFVAVKQYFQVPRGLWPRYGAVLDQPTLTS